MSRKSHQAATYPYTFVSFFSLYPLPIAVGGEE